MGFPAGCGGSAPLWARHCGTAAGINSGQLSDRRCAGGPRVTNSSGQGDERLSLSATGNARHSPAHLTAETPPVPAVRYDLAYRKPAVRKSPQPFAECLSNRSRPCLHAPIPVRDQGTAPAAATEAFVRHGLQVETEKRRQSQGPAALKFISILKDQTAKCNRVFSPRRRRIPKPMAPNPTSIKAQVAGSGTAALTVTESSAAP